MTHVLESRQNCRGPPRQAINPVLCDLGVVTAAVFEYAEFLAALCARTQHRYALFLLRLFLVKLATLATTDAIHASGANFHRRQCEQ